MPLLHQGFGQEELRWQQPVRSGRRENSKIPKPYDPPLLITTEAVT